MKVLMIAPACDGEDVGEAWVAFQWAKMLSEKHRPDVLDDLQARSHAAQPVQLARVPSDRVGGAPRSRPVRAAEQPHATRVRPVLRACSSMDSKATGGGRAVRRRPPGRSRRDALPLPRRGPGDPAGRRAGRRQPRVTSRHSSTRRVRRPGGRGCEPLDAWRIRHDPLLRRTYESAACVIGVAPYVQEFLGDSAHPSIRDHERDGRARGPRTRSIVRDRTGTGATPLCRPDRSHEGTARRHPSARSRRAIST